MEIWRVDRPDGLPDALTVGYGQSVAILAPDRDRSERLARPLRRQGARVELWDEGQALPPVHLLIIDGDAPDAPARAERLLRQCRGLPSCPVAVITAWCREQVFPADPMLRAIRLRAPLSAVTARVLMEYVAARSPA